MQREILDILLEEKNLKKEDLILSNDNYQSLVGAAIERLGTIIEEFTHESSKIYIHNPPRYLYEYINKLYKKNLIELTVKNEVYSIVKDENNNIIKSEKYEEIESEGNIIINKENKKIIATIGVEDIVIVNTEDALLVCHKDKSQEIKKILDKIEKK